MSSQGQPLFGNPTPPGPWSVFEAIGNAVRSGRLPVRGKRRLYDTTFAEIDQLIPRDAKVDVLMSRITFRPSEVFMDVETDLPSLENWLRDYAVPNGLLIEPDQQPTTKANALEALKRWLRRQQDHPASTKDDVWEQLQAGTHPIGDLGKQISRRSFNSAWTNQAPHAWRKPGRRPRRS